MIVLSKNHRYTHPKISKMANEYEEHLLEGELNPQFVKEVEEAQEEKSITFSSIDELDSLVENI